MIYEFELPLPPSVNKLYVPRYNHSKRKPFMQESAEAKNYKKAVALLLSQHVAKNGTLQERGIKIHVDFYLSHDRDVDNGIKILFDALTDAKFWVDDRLVYKLSATKQKARISVVRVIVECTQNCISKQ